MAKLWRPHRPALVRASSLGDAVQWGRACQQRQMMPHQQMMLAYGAATSITSCASVGTSASNTSSITLPSGIQAGDLIAVGCHTVGSGSTTTYATAPAGWTSAGPSIQGGTTAPQYQEIFLKIADGTESSTSFTSPITGATNTWMVCSVFRANIPIAFFAQKKPLSVSNTADPAAIVLDCDAANVSPCQLVLGMYGAHSGITVSPRTFTNGGSPSKDNEIGTSGQETWMAWKFFASAPTDTTIDMDDEGATPNNVFGVIVELYGGAQSALTAIAAVGQAHIAGSATLTLPGDIRAGDIIVCFDWAQNNSGSPTSVVPTGFTSGATALLSTIQRIVISYKLAAGTEGGATLTGMTGTFFDAKWVWVLRGNKAISTASASPQDPEILFVTTDPGDATMGTSGGTPPCLGLAFYGEPTGAGLSLAGLAFTNGGNDVRDNIVGNFSAPSVNRMFAMAYRLFTSSPVDVTVGLGDNGTNIQAHFYLNLT